MKYSKPDLSLLDAPMSRRTPTPVYAPMTVRQFRYLSSMLAVCDPLPSMRRRDYGPEPLEPFSPIARAALPKLKSLRQ